jgi:hypothetical protein
MYDKTKFKNIEFSITRALDCAKAISLHYVGLKLSILFNIDAILSTDNILSNISDPAYEHISYKLFFHLLCDP